MKKVKILVSSLCIALALTSLGHNNPWQETREAKFVFDISTSTQIEVDGKNTSITVETWNKDQVEVIARLEFKGKLNDQAEKFIADFENIVNENIQESASRLIIDTNLKEPNKIQIGSRHVGFIVGYNDDELRISYMMKVPGQNDLKIKNSYQDIVLNGDYTGAVNIDHYSGDLKAELLSDLELQLKYGSAEIERIGNFEMNLYEQELTINELRSGEIESKYSKIKLGSTENLSLNSYETKIEIESLNSLEGELKYGRIEIGGTTDRIELNSIYELDMELGTVGAMRLIESKYSDFEILEIGSLIQNESYEDDFVIQTLGNLKSEAKYSTYEIEELEGNIDLDGYECDVDVNKLSIDSKSILVKGKYGKLNLYTYDLPFHLDVDIQYGDIDYPDRMEKKVYIKDNSKVEMQMSTRNATDLDLMIEIKGYEMDANIK